MISMNYMSLLTMPMKGIWQWVCVSMPPGITSFPVASITRTPSPASRFGPTALVWGSAIVFWRELYITKIMVLISNSITVILDGSSFNEHICHLFSIFIHNFASLDNSQLICKRGSAMYVCLSLKNGIRKSEGNNKWIPAWIISTINR